MYIIESIMYIIRIIEGKVILYKKVQIQDI
jgi:hypothetical protein